MSLTISPARIVDESDSPLLQAPENWGRRPLGEVATIFNGFAFKSRHFATGRGIPLIRIRDLFKTQTEVCYVGEYDERYIVHTGDLLVGMDGDFNCTRWAGGDALLNQRVCKVTPRSDLLDIEYLALLLPAYLRAIHDATSSTTVTHLSSRDVAEIPLPVPRLADQRGLARTVSAVSARQKSAAQHVASASSAVSALRHAVLAAGCSGRLTADWRAASGRDNEAETSNEPAPLVDTPESWHWTTLGEIADIRGGVQVGAKRSGTELAREVPYLRVANVQKGWLDLTEMKTIRVPESTIAALTLQPGDIFFNEGGDRDKLGRGWIWEGQISECIHQNHVFRARLRDRTMQPRFFSWYGNTYGMRYFFDEGKQTVNLASLSKTRLSQLPVPIPSSDEQAEIVGRIDALLQKAARLDGRIETAARVLEETPTAAIAKALRGDLAPAAHVASLGVSR